MPSTMVTLDFHKMVHNFCPSPNTFLNLFSKKKKKKRKERKKEKRKKKKKKKKLGGELGDKQINICYQD